VIEQAVGFGEVDGGDGGEHGRFSKTKQAMVAARCCAVEAR
jgi:hypothetical protein